MCTTDSTCFRGTLSGSYVLFYDRSAWRSGRLRSNCDRRRSLTGQWQSHETVANSNLSTSFATIREDNRKLWICDASFGSS